MTLTLDPTTISILTLTAVALYQQYLIYHLRGGLDDVTDSHNRFVDAVVEAAEMGGEDQ